ncbi:MAG: AbiV family abortive infection protein [Candidatus Acidiferrales bacterium]|jgi:AbiV family abortive infection protein
MKTQLKKVSKETEISTEEKKHLRALYRECFINAHQLLNEGKLLAEHGHYARATFLALTAHEEMGKAQLIADYAQGCSSKKEFQEAFRDHRIKHAYMMREATAESDATIVYNKDRSTYQIELREKALYVAWRNTYDNLVAPSQITRDECDSVFERVLEAFEEIEHAERLNGRIGSKGLFK